MDGNGAFMKCHRVISGRMRVQVDRVNVRGGRHRCVCGLCQPSYCTNEGVQYRGSQRAQLPKLPEPGRVFPIE
jgi:hypothetical protein